MHARRIIKIILVLLAIFFILLIGIWLVGRNTAKKNEQTPLSFRQFLGLGTSTKPENTLPGAGSSTFTNPNDGTNAGGTTGSGQSSTNGSGNGAGLQGALSAPQTSQFTNNGISPVTLNGGSNQSVDNLTAGGVGVNNNLVTNSITTPSISSGASACSEADTNIDFTPDEIAKLNELQNQFYAVAQTLHTDADVDTEQANHDAFALKADQDTELYNYCKNALPIIAAQNSDARLNLHVATPFWNNSATDNISMLDYYSGSGLDAAHLASVHDRNAIDGDSPDTSGIKGPYGALNLGAPNSLPINGSIVKANPHVGIVDGKLTTTTTTDFQLLVPVVEKILRINLW